MARKHPAPAVLDPREGARRAVAGHARATLLRAQDHQPLDELPKSQQPMAKRSLQEIWTAETSQDAVAAFESFIAACQPKYDRAAPIWPGSKNPVFQELYPFSAWLPSHHEAPPAPEADLVHDYRRSACDNTFVLAERVLQALHTVR